MTVNNRNIYQASARREDFRPRGGGGSVGEVLWVVVATLEQC